MNTNSKNTEVTTALNALLGSGWSAYAQHHAHVALLRSWGIEGLAADMAAAIADEPAALTQILNRLLDLEGAPSYSIPTPDIGTDLQSVLDNDLQVQRNSQPALVEIAELAATDHDVTTRNLVEAIIADEEEHLNWLKTELDLFHTLGQPLYIANRLTPPGGVEPQ